MLSHCSMRDFDGIEHVKKIWILEQVLLAGSLKEAAIRARVTPPAVSQAITALEKVVGKPLILRRNGTIIATDVALEMIKTAAPAIRVLSSLAVSTRENVPSISWLSFGTYESLAVTLLPGFMNALQEKLPKAKLTVRIARTGTLATMVRKGELCAALVTESDSLGRLTCTEIAQDRLGVFVSPKEKARIKNFDSLQSFKVGTLSSGTDGFPRYYKKFVDRVFGDKFTPSLVSDSFEALRAAARHSGIAVILPERVANRDLGELVEVRSPEQDDASLGVHRIYLISLTSCDPVEVLFLESELKAILLALGYHTSH